MLFAPLFPLSKVPGIGEKASEKLAEGDDDNDKVTTTYQLIGKYLSLMGEGIDCVEHHDRFWYWLKEKGVNSHRSGIVQCIAEKVSTWVPGLYDPGMYE